MSLDILRTPPHSIDAECAVLGGLMIDQKSLSLIADWLTEDDFYRRDHRLIFRAIAFLSEQNKPCDAVTMAEWFDDNGLTEIVDTNYVLQVNNSTPSAANIVAYAEIVREKAQLRRCIDEGTALAGRAFERGADSTDILAQSLHSLSVMSASKVRGGLSPVKPAMKLLFAEMIERYNKGPGLLGIPTPWHEVNELTKGLRPGVLYVIGARPSMGKSVFAENVAGFSALRGVRTAFFAVEMTAQEILARACASHGDIPFDFVEQPNDKVEDAALYWSRHTTVTKLLVESPLLIDDTPSLRIEQLMARARREHRRSPLGLIVIDHLHDMHTDPKLEVRHEYGRITQGAKTLAKEMNCPVMLFAQLSRKLADRGDKRPTLTDLRESGEIEQKADVVLFLHREDYYDKESHMRGIVEVIPAKGRNIRIDKTIHLSNRFDRMRLDDFDGPLPLPSAKQTSRGFGRTKVAEIVNVY